MGMGKYILVDKKPVEVEDVLEWGKFFEKIEERRVKNDKFLNDSITVSTIFIGIDHSFTDEGPPILFETMIFGGVHSEYQDRYCTWEEAEVGHLKAVELILTQALEDRDWNLVEEIRNKFPKMFK